MSSRLDATTTDSHDASEKSCKTYQEIKQRFPLLTQTEVSEKSGIKLSTVHRIASEKRGIFLKELQPILAALDLAIIKAEGGETRTISEKEYQSLRRLLHLYSEPED